MYARRTVTRVLRQHVSVACRPRSNNLQLTRRYTSGVPAPSVVAKAHPLAGVASQIDKIAPRFEIDASQIEIVDSPTAFYATLKVTRLYARAWNQY